MGFLDMQMRRQTRLLRACKKKRLKKKREKKKNKTLHCEALLCLCSLGSQTQVASASLATVIEGNPPWGQALCWGHQHTAGLLRAP